MSVDNRIDSPLDALLAELEMAASASGVAFGMDVREEKHKKRVEAARKAIWDYLDKQKQSSPDSSAVERAARAMAEVRVPGSTEPGGDYHKEASWRAVLQMDAKAAIGALASSKDRNQFVEVNKMGPDSTATVQQEDKVYSSEQPDYKPLQTATDGYRDEQPVAFTPIIDTKLIALLEKLSCLGNGELPGNSIGNVMAQEALEMAKNPPYLCPPERESIDFGHLAAHVASGLGALKGYGHEDTAAAKSLQYVMDELMKLYERGRRG